MTVTDEYLELVALGMYALGAPLMSDVEAGWQALDETARARFRAHARFVLSFADASALDAGRHR